MTDEELATILRRLAALEKQEREPRAEALRYATGAYTPTYTGSGSAGATTYTTQSGGYFRQGDVVHVRGRVAWTNATGTGAALISLPFTAAGGGGLLWPANLWVNNVTFAGSGVQAVVEGGTNFLYFASPNSNAAFSQIDVETAGDIAFVVTYFLS